MRSQGPGRWPKLLAGLAPLLFLIPGLWDLPDAWAGSAASQQQAGKKALHGQSWAFGQSEDRKAAIWRRGVPAQSLKQKAVTGASAAKAGRGKEAKAASGKNAAGKRLPGKGAVDTGDAIERALSAARAASQAEEAKAAEERGFRPRGSLGLSMKDSTTTWNVTPMREAMRPDEVLVRDRQHVVRAFADVEPTDDLSIRVGPELILKDEQHAAESAGSSQPDSALGLGMRFKLDF
ncbi:hypothetical protein [Desulfovibrio sp.]|uniref:hypothetical protein n=1 Tax=Desulfovibrio sp. TaxID=885 RepID=UPI0023BBC3EC|nr:hypothetical protein [Desulfovibrio sp.]MDE7241882.1 hypothetical protein [Desulfovibrio sp.]